ncbi:sodium:calcium antiporter [Halapricum hydrolyticum]|uniref:Sodium:calcium antiporter n=1 Tax=Halapricum hydrolyticum TaxID=2979991 RepID=A0AAE3IAT4_9EURY|nr:sodium:calcium antiporter [Halapricum hydrolyticum]MCU4717538.1 sodium:calcium antiporter [Halapricum hydrolyticum]MCU4726702.1 sodium:calcium antiporter [Halapricum hydrolyticum]
MATLAVDVVIILLTTGVIWIGSGWLENASERLATYYGLPEVVQGSIVTAIGSSFPELATVVVAAITVNSLELGVGTIVGSAVFNILVIPALAGITTAEKIEANRALVYKEALFYMLAVSVLVITFALAVIYYPVGGVEYLAGNITRPLALVPLGMYGLYVFIQYQDTADHESDDDGSDIAIGRQWGLLVAGLVAILIAVERLVHSVDVIGTALGVPDFIMGVTIAAAATSLPDAMVSVRAASEERGIASLANVLGSNTFDLLVAIPIGVMLVGSTPINFSMAIPMFAVLTLSTVLLFTALRTDLALSVIESYGLLAAYALFVVWVVLEALDVAVDLLPT